MRAILSGFVAVLMVAVIASGGAWGASGPSGRFYLHFSGNAQYVEIPAAEDLSVGPQGFTVSAWMRPDTLEFAKMEGSGYVYWIGKGAPNQQEWALRMYSRTNREKPPRLNRISFYLFNLNGGLGEGSYFEEPVRPGEWIQVTAVVAGDTVAIFRNGVYVRCDEYNGHVKGGCQAHDERIHPTIGTAPLRLGTRDFKSFFQGGLSEVRIWSRPLQPDEITRLYRANEVPRGGLTAAFLLDEGKGDTARDSMRRHKGRIFGATWVRTTGE